MAGRIGENCIMSVPNRPTELAAFEDASSMTDSQLVQTVRAQVGARMTAYVARVSSTSRLREWIDHEVPINAACRIRLEILYRIVRLICERDDKRVAVVWLQGMNPALGDRTPLQVLADSGDTEVQDSVLAAARTFIAE